MFNLLVTLLFFIIALSILVCFHEFGHFIVARLLGVKVLRFSVGFGRPFLRYMSKSGTEYVISALPLGGYVKMLDETEGKVAPEELSGAFNRKPVGVRIAIVLAGPLFNIILAVILYWLVFVIGIVGIVPIIGYVFPESIAQQAGLQVNDRIATIGQQRVSTWNDVNLALLSHLGSKSSLSIGVQNTVSHVFSSHRLNLSAWNVDPLHPKPLKSLGIHPFQPKVLPIVGKVFLNSPATLAGLQPGDQILQIDNQPIKDWQQMRAVVDYYGDHKLNLLVLRKHQKIYLKITPKQTADGKKGAYLGIESSLAEFPPQYLRTEKYSLLQAWQPAVIKTWTMIHLTFDLLIKMIVGDVSIKTMSGPIGIAQGAGMSASYGLSTFLDFLALMSISLGVLNILPIPVLDGGHLLFYLIELVRGKPVSLRSRQISMQIGLLLLLALVFFAFYNDFNRILS